MRYTVTIPQAGIAEAGLLGRVSLETWILLRACARFFFFKKAERLPSDDGGAPYVWFDIRHALDEFPLLWPTAKPQTRRNRATAALRELIDAGLLDTRRGARGRLYVRLTELAIGLDSTPATTGSRETL